MRFAADHGDWERFVRLVNHMGSEVVQIVRVLHICPRLGQHARSICLSARSARSRSRVATGLTEHLAHLVQPLGSPPFGRDVAVGPDQLCATDLVPPDRVCAVQLVRDGVVVSVVVAIMRGIASRRHGPRRYVETRRKMNDAGGWRSRHRPFGKVRVGQRPVEAGRSSPRWSHGAPWRVRSLPQSRRSSPDRLVVVRQFIDILRCKHNVRLFCRRGTDSMLRLFVCARIIIVTGRRQSLGFGRLM